MGEEKKTVEKDNNEKTADGRKHELMGIKDTINHVIDILTDGIDPKSKEYEVAEFMRKSLEKDLEEYKDEPWKLEAILRGKLAILKETVNKEVGYLEPEIVYRLFNGENNDDINGRPS